MTVASVTGDVPQRHLTALKRIDLSRPVNCAIRDGLLPLDRSFFDYGCGRGDDLRRLRAEGYDCAGWDPVHQPDGTKRSADVVNLGYVVNVIENPIERMDTLRAAWECTRRLLVVSARLAGEAPAAIKPLADGILTSRGTFQKFFEQQELRDWIEATLGEKSVAAAPGVFYVFRSDSERESFSASRFRTRHAAPRVRRSDALYEAHREVLEPLARFVSDRGRLPDPSELEDAERIVETVGSLQRAFSVIQRATGADEWRQVRDERAGELLLYLGLVRFFGRPKAAALPLDLRLDVKAFFGNYKRACDEADKLLFSAGDLAAIEASSKASSVGKSAGPALYVHSSALSKLPALLRIYEGCAKACIGSVDDANVIKLHRDEPKVSYLAYPEFDSDPHPALLRSMTVHLQTFRVRETDFSDQENPPILHRKEQFVGADYPLREKFARLTQQEERHGLFEDTVRIGRRRQWAELLEQKGLRLRGHRLIRASSQPDLSSPEIAL